MTHFPRERHLETLPYPLGGGAVHGTSSQELFEAKPGLLRDGFTRLVLTHLVVYLLRRTRQRHILLKDIASLNQLLALRPGVECAGHVDL